MKIIKELNQKIIDNILNYTIKQKNRDLKAPLLLEIPHTDLWKIHILKIYYYTHKIKIELFKAYDLRSVLGISIRHIYKHLNNFIKNGYIKKDQTIRGRYKFTPSGHQKLKEIEKHHKLISSKIKKQIL